jgi:hypothetical protein
VENITATVCPRVDYTVSLRVVAPDGSVIAQHDSIPAEGLLPTSQWRAGDYVQDEHPLNLPPELPPGEYRIEVVVYNAATGDSIAAYGVPTTNDDLVSAQIGEITVQNAK